MGVLLLIVTLAMLAGAMVTVHRSHWAMSRGQDQRIAAHQACLSAVSYARDRLQADPAWGTLPFGAATVRLQLTGKLVATEQGSDVATNNLVLDLPGSDCSATLHVVNNLNGDTTAAPPSSCSRDVLVPAHSAFLVVLGRSGGQQRRIEMVLRRRPPLDGALYAGEDIAFIPSAGGTTPQVDFDGEDATKNKLRSRREIYLPNVARFLSRGAATGTSDVTLGASVTVDPVSGVITDPGDGTSLATHPDQQATMESTLNASLSVAPVPPTGLEAGDLTTGTGTVHALPGGRYTFVGPGQVQFEPAGGGPTVTYQDAIYAGGAVSGTPDQLAVALTGRKFMIQGQVESAASLELDSVGVSSQAELALGYSSVDGGVNESSGSSSLRVTGDLQVRGHLVGQGTVAALKPAPSSSQGNIVVSGRSSLASGTSSGLAIYGEGDVRLRPTEVSGDITFAADFEAMRIAMTDPTTSNPSLLANFDDFEVLTSSARDTLIGLDEFRFGAGTGSLRDSQISASDYTTQVQSLIPNWPTMTPSGQHPLPTAATTYVQNCLAGGAGFDGGMTLGRHTRLMAFLRSVDEGNPEPGWLNQVNWSNSSDPDHGYNQLVKGVLKNQLLRVAQDARLEGSSPSDWLNLANTYYSNRHPRDIDWRGLIYAKGRLWGDGNEHIDVVGALGAETGSLIFSNFKSSRVKFHHSELNSIFRISSLQLEGYSCYMD